MASAMPSSPCSTSMSKTPCIVVRSSSWWATFVLPPWCLKQLQGERLGPPPQPRLRQDAIYRKNDALPLRRVKDFVLALPDLPPAILGQSPADGRCSARKVSRSRPLGRRLSGSRIRQPYCSAKISTVALSVHASRSTARLVDTVAGPATRSSSPRSQPHSEIPRSSARQQLSGRLIRREPDWRRPPFSSDTSIRKV